MNRFFLSSLPKATMGMLLFSTILVACGVKKKPITVTEKPNIESPSKLEVQPKDYLNNYIRYQTFKASSDTEINMPNLNQSVEMNLKALYQDKTYGQIKAGGFGLTLEVAQLYTSKDSIVLLDKFNMKYYLLDWAQSQSILNIKLDHDMFQNIIVGNPPILSTQYEKFSFTDSTVNIDQQIGNDIQKLVYDKKSKRLKEFLFMPSASDYILKVELSDYAVHSATQIAYPSHLLWTISQPGGNASLEFSYTNVEFNRPVDIQFSIPFRFKKEEIR